MINRFYQFNYYTQKVRKYSYDNYNLALFKEIFVGLSLIINEVTINISVHDNRSPYSNIIRKRIILPNKSHWLTA